MRYVPLGIFCLPALLNVVAARAILFCSLLLSIEGKTDDKESDVQISSSTVSESFLKNTYVVLVARETIVVSVPNKNKVKATGSICRLTLTTTFPLREVPATMAFGAARTKKKNN